jgi:hypothetical protein
MRFVAAFACSVMLTCLGAMPSYAEKRVALVVGNDRYANLPADQQLRKAVRPCLHGSASDCLSLLREDFFAEGKQSIVNLRPSGCFLPIPNRVLVDVRRIFESDAECLLDLGL